MWISSRSTFALMNLNGKTRNNRILESYDGRYPNSQIRPDPLAATWTFHSTSPGPVNRSHFSGSVSSTDGIVAFRHSILPCVSRFPSHHHSHSCQGLSEFFQKKGLAKAKVGIEPSGYWLTIFYGDDRSLRDPNVSLRTRKMVWGHNTYFLSFCVGNLHFGSRFLSLEKRKRRTRVKKCTIHQNNCWQT